VLYTRIEWLVTALAVALFAYRARLSWNDSVDDVYIYVRYARNLAEHGQLAFNLGQPVEGFSSPLWVLLLGGLWKLGAAGLAPAKSLSLACSFATLLVTLRTLHAADAKWASLWILAALSLDCDFARWAVSGMDTPLFALGCASVLFFAATRRFRLLAVAIGFLPWLRPEGLFVGGLLGVLMLTRQEARRVAWLALLPVALLFALRFTFFHEVLPNTFYAKMTPGGGRVYSGGAYVWSFIKRRPILVMLAIVAALQKAQRLTLSMQAAIVTTIATFLFALLAHGDWMANHRFLVPAIACILVVAATLKTHAPLALLLIGTETLLSTTRRLDQSWRGNEALSDSFTTLVPDPVVKPEPLDWMPSHILRNLSYYVLPGETVAHVDMGQLPYVMHDVMFLDGFGLVDREVARLTYAPSSARRGIVADAFFRAGSAAAVLVISKDDEQPVTLGQAAFFSDPRFLARYREQSRVGTWGGNLCVIFVRRDRAALAEEDAVKNEHHWLAATPEVRSVLPSK
jgi:hypothetical protein